MNRYSYSKINFIFTAALLFFIGVGTFWYRESVRLNQTAEDRIFSAEFATKYEKLERLVAEAKASQRGFLLTGKDQAIKHYQETIQEIPRLMGDLKHDIDIRPTADKEKDLLADLDKSIQTKIVLMNSVLEAKQKKGLPAAIALLTSVKNETTSMEIKNNLNDLILIENAVRNEEATDAESTSHASSLAFVWGSLIALGIMISAMVMIKRGLKREQEANLEKQRFAVLVQNSGDLIAISGADRIMNYLNPSGMEMLGADPKIFENKNGADASQFYSAEYNERMRNEIIPAVREKGHWSGEFCYQNIITKELIPVLMNVFSLTDPNTGKPLGMAVVSRDIRDRKKLEKQLDRFFNVSLDMLCIANLKGYFIRLNPSFSTILGYTEEELCSRPCTEFIHPDDIGPTIDQLRRQANGETIMSFENRYRNKNGNYHWFSWKSYPDGDLTYGAARDVTEEKRQHAVMEKLRQEAVAASMAKSEFLANMSHEIRTPINGVVGMTTLLLDTTLNPQQLEYAENIMTSADSLLTVINDILDFSKIEAGKLDIEKVDFSLENLIDETAKNMSWAVKNKSLPFIVSCERDAKFHFRGDPGRIRQVLNNLLSNAIKFTSKGSITLAIQPVSSSGNATRFRFSVKDTGIGLSPAAQKKMFQAFSQADASTARKFGGTGLGLSICKRLIELMGGEIGVESVEGQGSEFWFTLTLDQADGSAVKTKTGLQFNKTNYPGAQILVAEDNFINQKILLTMLEKMGFKAQAVANGNEVLSLLRERSFDLILMDCQMPELDGYAATQKIRASTTLDCSQIPIVAMTANALKGDREKCIESGMNDYASKPISMENLSIVVEKWLAAADFKKRSA